MKPKGVSPVIATILVVMITVGLVASSYTWFMGVGEKGKESSERMLSQMEKAQQNIKIGTAYQCGDAICFEIRTSSGNSAPMPMNQTNYYINDKPVRMDGWNGEGTGISCTGGVAPDSLAGSWHFSEGSGNITHDDSGNENDGTLYGGLDVTGWTDGMYGNALEFDGNDDYVHLEDTQVINNTFSGNEATMVMWLYPITSAGDWSDYMYFVGGFGNRHRIEEGNGGADSVGVYFADDNGTHQGFARDNVLTVNTWNHVVGVYNSTHVIMYVDGEYIHSRALSFILGGVSGNCRIEDGFHNCKMDEIQIYNRALSAEEVQQLYNLKLSPGKKCYGRIPDYDCDMGDKLRIEHSWGASDTISISSCS